MKILYAECCATLVVPDKTPEVPRKCDCGKCHVWWDHQNRLVLHADDRSEASVIGLHNDLLRRDMGNNLVVFKTDIEDILSNTPDNYLFKKHGSLIIRVKVGVTGDIRWATDPEVVNILHKTK